MTWGPWLTYRTLRAGTTVLSICDYLGESLASLFGITTPKYLREIEESRRQRFEEQVKLDSEYGGWQDTASSAQIHEKEKF